MSKIPTATDETWFWSLIESAWDRTGGEPSVRRKALIAREDDTEAYVLGAYLDEFVDNLRVLSADLTGEELTALDRVLERKLHDIDRPNIQAVTDGGAEGFLYRRGFVVAMGQDFYEAVVTSPWVAVLDAECEEMCYFFANLHLDRFGEFPRTDSGISR